MGPGNSDVIGPSGSLTLRDTLTPGGDSLGEDSLGDGWLGDVTDSGGPGVLEPSPKDIEIDSEVIGIGMMGVVGSGSGVVEGVMMGVLVLAIGSSLRLMCFGNAAYLGNLGMARAPSTANRSVPSSAMVSRRPILTGDVLEY